MISSHRSDTSSAAIVCNVLKDRGSSTKSLARQCCKRFFLRPAVPIQVVLDCQHGVFLGTMGSLEFVEFQSLSCCDILNVGVRGCFLIVNKVHSFRLSLSFPAEHDIPPLST